MLFQIGVSLLAGFVLSTSTSTAPAPTGGQWLQWGGPRRDFTCDAGGLADKWPPEGPRQLWSREIGPGHSTVLVDGDRLYTMCRRDDKDAVLAVSAADGQTVWETQYDAPTKEGMDLEMGAGPHSTPLIVGDRIFTVGGTVLFHCLDKRTGKILWSHDLMAEMGASHLRRGYGASPIAYKDLVILNVGGGDTAVAAFKQDSGELAWKSEKFPGGYASPILIRLNDEDHLVVALAGDWAGLDPATGKTKWHTTVDTQSFGIMSTPLWIEPDRLFFSAGYGGGTRLLKVNVKDGEYAPEELWHYRKMQVNHGTMARIGEYVYASSGGSFDPAFMMAIELKTGKPAWRDRTFAKANVLLADGKLVILDEQGTLAIATATPEKLEVLAQAKVLEEKAWTAPTLVGTRMYLRDNHTLKALDLSAAANS